MTYNEINLYEVAADAMETVRRLFKPDVQKKLLFTMIARDPDNPTMSLLISEDPDPEEAMRVVMEYGEERL